MNADRNLLCGIIAVQLGFIGRRALVDAMNDWILEKSVPLGDILIDQSAITKSQRDLVDQLVDQHLEFHGGDAAKSLASVSSIGSLRDELAQVGPELSLCIRHIGTANDDDPDRTQGYIEPRGISVGESSSQSRRFRILRPHAQGGLGHVSVAHDEELNREVALKEILEQHADDSVSRARFALEAEITGGLEHPGIVPVYGLGTNADGRPFYAMRFIRGDSLKDGIDHYNRVASQLDSGKRSVLLRKLLGRFIDVCNAIQYAHSRGVLHRDLKPGNVMLGKYGETLVVDWGLAKAIGRPGEINDEPALSPSSGSRSTPTQMGSAIGTPTYMSPEQAAGRLNELGPLSDVYSLGATLYSLLTGKPPFHGDIKSVLRDVQRGTFPRPRDVNPSVAPALEAVCLKAMMLEQMDRYQSPQEIADEIEKWLADEPVRSYPDPILARTGRWIRRHQSAASGFGAALLVGTVSLLAGITLLGSKNTQLAQQNTQLNIANGKIKKSNEALRVANDRERVAKTEAVENAQIAIDRSDLALETLDLVIFDIQRRLKYVAGAREVRRSLLMTSLDGLSKISSRLETQSKTDRSTMAAHNDLGDIFLRLSGEEGLGGLANAQKEYEVCLGIARKLSDADPDDVRSQLDLTLTCDKLGDVHQRLGSTAEALKYYEQSRDISRRLAKADPDEDRAKRALVNSYVKLGEIHFQLGSTSEALKYYEQSLDISKVLAGSDPDDHPAQRALVISYSGMGEVHVQLGSTAEALKYFQNSYDISTKLANPGDDQSQRDHSICLEQLGNVHFTRGSSAEALKYFDQSLEIRKMLAESDPNDAQAQRDLSILHFKLGNGHYQLGANNEALKYYKESLVIKTKLVDAEPGNAQAQHDLFISLERLGDVYVQLGSMAEGMNHYKKSLEISEMLAKADPYNARVQRALSIMCGKLGGLHLRLGLTTDGMKYYGRSLEISELLAEADPSNAQVQRDLSILYGLQGNIHLQLGSTGKALKYYKQSAEIIRRLAVLDPRDSHVQGDLLGSYARLGGLHHQLGSTDEAMSYYEQSLEISRKLVKANPEVTWNQRSLVTCLYKLGTVRQETRQFIKAISCFEQALSVIDEMVNNGQVESGTGESIEIKQNIEACRNALRAIREIDFALSQPPDQAKTLLLIRAAVLSELGNHEAVADTADALRSLGPMDADNLYNTTCCFLYCVRAVAFKELHDGRPVYRKSDELNEIEKNLQADYTKKAIETLTNSLRHGFDNLAHMEQDSDLDGIREEPEFTRLLEQLRAQFPNNEDRGQKCVSAQSKTILSHFR